MEFVVIAALAAAGVGLALPFKDSRVRERWRELASRLGFQFQPGQLLESDGMEGRFGGYSVRIDNQRRQGTRIAVAFSGPKDLRVQPRHLWFFEAGERSDDRLSLEDERVSGLVRQVGLARLFLVLLDPTSEARLDAGVYSAHVSIERGELVFSCPERIDDPELLGAVLGGLARLAEGLERPDRLAERLGENARAIAAPVWRKLACLHLLLEHFPESTECGRAAWSIAQAMPVHSPDGLRLRLLALRHLHVGNPRSDLLPVVDEALGRPNPALRAVAVEALLSLGPDQAIPRLVEAAKDKSPQVAGVALRLLPLVADRAEARAERALLELLYRGEAETRLDVVSALGSIGSARAIGPLLDLERVADPGVKRLCRHALARLSKAYPERQGGSLSLVGSGGELSPPK